MELSSSRDRITTISEDLSVKLGDMLQFVIIDSESSAAAEFLKKYNHSLLIPIIDRSGKRRTSNIRSHRIEFFQIFLVLRIWKKESRLIFCGGEFNGKIIDIKNDYINGFKFQWKFQKISL